MFVEKVGVGGDEGGQLRAEEVASGHPLVVGAASVVVGPVEAAARDTVGEPTEETFVAGVHAEGDLRLASVSPEVALAGEDAEQEAHIPV